MVYSFSLCKLFYFLNIPKSINSPVGGHLGFRFFLLQTLHINILIPLSWFTCVRVSLGYICLRVELLKYKVDTSSALPDNAKLFLSDRCQSLLTQALNNISGCFISLSYLIFPGFFIVANMWFYCHNAANVK